MRRKLDKIDNLLNTDGFIKEHARLVQHGEVRDRGKVYPLKSYTIGSEDPKSPVLFLVGGVHGLERIGADLCVSFLEHTVERITWDEEFRNLLKKIKLVFYPLVNPWGYYHFRRANPNGVDLMRNSPVRTYEGAPLLLSGQKISHHIPWYMGNPKKFEKESQALVDCFLAEVKESPAVVAIDFHSGFGFRDRLWFPFSFTKKLFDEIAELHALFQLFEQSYPYHVYLIEPQSKGYLINGDIWDYLYFELKKTSSGIFLPMTLEMGSWNWVKKNPLQLASLEGMFNPIKEHRINRTYRRHHLLFDFLIRALYSNKVWSQLDVGMKMHHQNLAEKKWY